MYCDSTRKGTCMVLPAECKVRNIHVRTFRMVAAAAGAGTATADKQREAGGDDVELADLLPRAAPHLLQLLPLSHGT